MFSFATGKKPSSASSGLLVLLVVITIFSTNIKRSFQDTNEQRLHAFLFESHGNKSQYNTLIRPVIDSSKPIDITANLGIKRLFELDEVNLKITIFALSLEKWQDEFLKWEPKEFGDIEYIYLHRSSIWTPNLQLVSRYIDEKTSSDTAKEYSNCEYPVKLLSSGVVEFFSIVHLTSSCLYNNLRFPIDTQTCEFYFQLPYNRDKATFNMSVFFNEEYIDDSTWKIDADSIKAFASKDIDQNPLHVLQLKLQRKVRVYIFTLPSYIVYILTLLMFMLPQESNQRIMIGSSCIVITVMLTYMLSNSLPHNEISAWPLLGKLYLFNMVLLTFSMLFSVFINKLAHANHVRGVPDWLKKFTINFLSKIFCIQAITLSVFNSYNTGAQNEENLERKLQVNGELLMNSMDDFATTCSESSLSLRTNKMNQNSISRDQVDEETVYDAMNEDEERADGEETGYASTRESAANREERKRDKQRHAELTMTSILKRIHRHTDQMRYRLQLDAYKEGASNEWFLVASLVDKIFFFLYCFIIILTTVTIFKPEH